MEKILKNMGFKIVGTKENVEIFPFNDWMVFEVTGILNRTLVEKSLEKKVGRSHSVKVYQTGKYGCGNLRIAIR